MADRKSSRASAANLRNILRLIDLEENDLENYKNKIDNAGLKETLGKSEHLRWMAFTFLQGNMLWEDPVKTDIFTKANQTSLYYRHATLVEWEALPLIDKVFPDEKTFQEKDLEIIENLALIYQECNEQKMV